jgi:hypothetical protein
VAEALDIVRDVARKLIEAWRARDGEASLPGRVAAWPLSENILWWGRPEVGRLAVSLSGHREKTEGGRF